MQVLATIALAVFLGHVFFRISSLLRGGKGGGDRSGRFCSAFSYSSAQQRLSYGYSVALITRYSSLAALSAAVAAPLLDAVAHRQCKSWTGAVVVMAAILIWRHKGNIVKLLAGQEGRIGKKAGADAICARIRQMP